LTVLKDMNVIDPKIFLDRGRCEWQVLLTEPHRQQHGLAHATTTTLSEADNATATEAEP
jgi:hypothetical protein